MSPTRPAVPRILSAISLVISAGPPTLLLGPNGSGKTTFLKLAMGLLTPVAGRILYASGAEVARRRCAIVFQKPVMLRRSAARNVAFALKAAARAPEAATIAGLLQAVGLGGVAERPARRLSGGEQQRLALARALARDPDVLFLDEPTASLDPAATKSVEDIIARTAEARRQDRHGHPRPRPGPPARRRGGAVGQWPHRRARRGDGVLPGAGHGDGQALFGRRTHSVTRANEESAMAMQLRRLIVLLLFSQLALVLPASAEDKAILVASTTSTQDSGLFNFILPMFKATTGIDVRVIAQGTGQALDTGPTRRCRRGVRACKTAGRKFVADGFGVQRFAVMYNDFVLIGPKSDPAKIKGGNDVGRRAAGDRQKREPVCVARGQVGHARRRARPLEAGKFGSGQQQAGVVSRDRPRHGRGAEHGRGHGRLRAVRPGYLDFVQEQGRSGGRGGG